MSPAKLLFAVTFSAVTVLAFLPSYEPLPDVFSVSDVINHFLAFVTLYLLHTAAYPSVSRRTRSAVLLGYGVFIEAVQAFLPTRQASVSDIAVDSAAILTALLLHSLFYRLKPAA